MASDQNIRQQQERLEIHRQNVQHLLRQAAAYGGEKAAPLNIWNSLVDNRAEIAHCKNVLRFYGALVEDHPDDAVPDAAEALSGMAAAQSAQEHQPWMVPYQSNPAFMGRRSEFATLVKLLTPRDSKSAICIPALVGMGGMGKTQLAVEFAWYCREHQLFPGGIFWLNLERDDMIDAQIAEFGGPEGLGIFYDDTSPDVGRFSDHTSLAERVNRVQRALRRGQPRLLIFDNLVDQALLKPTLQRFGNCRVLITTRNFNWASYGDVHPIHLEALSAEDGAALLLEPRAKQHGRPVQDLLADPATRVSGQALVAMLGALPLALTLAGRYLAKSSLSLDEYRAQIQTESVRDTSLNITDLREELPTKHAASILATFRLSVDRLRSDEPVDQQARTIWLAAAQLAPEPIPQRLLLRCGDVDPDDRPQREQGDRAIIRLCELGLLQTASTSPVGSYQIHRLLAEYAHLSSNDQSRDRRSAERALVAELRSLDEHDQIDDAPRRYLDHVLHLVRDIDDRDDLQAAALCHECALLSYIQEDVRPAKIYGRRALELRKKLLGEHVETADSLYLFGLICRLEGTIDLAEEHLYNAKRLYESIFEIDHRKVAETYHYLGMVANTKNQFKKAFFYLSTSDKIKTRMCSQDDTSVASTRVEYGETAYKLGYCKLAFQCFLSAFRIYRSKNDRMMSGYCILYIAFRSVMLILYVWLVVAFVVWLFRYQQWYVQLCFSAAAFLICFCSIWMRRLVLFIRSFFRILISLYITIFIMMGIVVKESVYFVIILAITMIFVFFWDKIMSVRIIRSNRARAGAQVQLWARSFVHRKRRYKPRSLSDE